jgi:hypothetical protein
MPSAAVADDTRQPRRTALSELGRDVGRLLRVDLIAQHQTASGHVGGEGEQLYGLR